MKLLDPPPPLFLILLNLVLLCFHSITLTFPFPETHYQVIKKYYPFYSSRAFIVSPHFKDTYLAFVFHIPDIFSVSKVSIYLAGLLVEFSLFPGLLSVCLRNRKDSAFHSAFYFRMAASSSQGRKHCRGSSFLHVHPSPASAAA